MDLTLVGGGLLALGICGIIVCLHCFLKIVQRQGTCIRNLEKRLDLCYQLLDVQIRYPIKAAEDHDEERYYEVGDCTIFYRHGGGPKTVCTTTNPYFAQSIALALNHVLNTCKDWYDADRESPHALMHVWAEEQARQDQEDKERRAREPSTRVPSTRGRPRPQNVDPSMGILS